MKTEFINISEVKPNPENPRVIKDGKFKKLVESIKSFPKMLEMRPIVVDADMVALGGNMRLKACEAAGMRQVPVLKADELTEAQRREFIIKDNVSYGEFDWDALANDWNIGQLDDWGLDVPEEKGDDDETYSRKVQAPVYEPSGDMPALHELYSENRCNELIREIEQADVSDDVKVFLKAAAHRHVVFNYENIAEYYAHADAEVQRLMENSALVVIDFDKAIELGFVRLSDSIQAAFTAEQGE